MKMDYNPKFHNFLEKFWCFDSEKHMCICYNSKFSKNSQIFQKKCQESNSKLTLKDEKFSITTILIGKKDNF